MKTGVFFCLKRDVFGYFYKKAILKTLVFTGLDIEKCKWTLKNTKRQWFF